VLYFRVVVALVEWRKGGIFK